MNILVLGPSNAAISNFLTSMGYSVLEHNDSIDTEFLERNSIDFAVSFRYRYIIKSETISFLQGNIINLHISYLPWNRGADPNLWSFLEDTPKGVTIHYIDPGIDTGDIIVQKEVFFDEEKETLATTYEFLNNTIIQLFNENCEAILNGRASKFRQKGHGTEHKIKDKEPYLYLLAEKGWNTPVLEVKGKALQK